MCALNEVKGLVLIMKKENKYFYNILYSFILIPLFQVISIYLTMAALKGSFLSILNIKSALFNFLIIEFINIFLLLITKSTKKSLTAISVLIYLICFVNQVKIFYMNEPLYISDLNFLQNYSNIGIFTKGSILMNICILLLKTIPIIIFIIVIFFISKKFEVKITNKYRIIYSVVVLLLFVLVLYPFHVTKKIYYKYIYTDTGRNVDEYVDYEGLYTYYGIFSGIYYQYINSKIDYSKPVGYNQKKLSKLENVEKNMNTIGKPNIIVILSESFFNINNIEENIKFKTNVIKNYESLKKEGTYVNVISPAYGGQTANIVFELLTGGNISYFAQGFVPFQDLYREKRERPSLVKVLKENGYQTSLLVGADSYDSEKTMKEIGFDKFSVAEGKIKGRYLSDDSMANLIIEELEKEDKNKFIMVETMQNHMPYYKEKYENYKVEIESTTLNNNDANIIKSYAEGLHDADKMLKKVYDYIKKEEKETILVFFGDHLPLLKDSKFGDLNLKLNYFTTDNTLKNTYRKYATEALILNNFNMNLDEKEYLGYDLLLNYIINNMDLNIPNYYRWLYKTTDILPTYNRYIAINAKNELVSISKLNDKEKETLNLRNQMFYKNFIEK